MVTCYLLRKRVLCVGLVSPPGKLYHVRDYSIRLDGLLPRTLHEAWPAASSIQMVMGRGPIPLYGIPFAHNACSLRSLATHPKGGVQMGGAGGRRRSPRLPPQLHSDRVAQQPVTFMAKGPLEGPVCPGKTRGLQVPRFECGTGHYMYRAHGPFGSAKGSY